MNVIAEYEEWKNSMWRDCSDVDINTFSSIFSRGIAATYRQIIGVDDNYEVIKEDDPITEYEAHA